MDGGVAAVGAISSALNVSIRLWQATYELKTVDQKSRDLLATAAHVDLCLNAVKTLRRQKSGLLSRFEKDYIDKIVVNTGKTVQDVAALVEPARVDMDNNCGKVKFKNRVAFALRDSQLVGTNLSRLEINSSSLNTAMGILCCREGNRQILDLLDGRPRHRGLANNAGDAHVQVNNPTEIENRPPPPAYHEIMMRRRAEDERRKSLLSSVRNQVLPEGLNGDFESMDLKNGSMIADNIGQSPDTETLPPPIPPRPVMVEKHDVVTTVTQVDDTPIFLGMEKPLPTPPADKISMQVSPSISWEGADGLQVVPSDGIEVLPAETSENMPPHSRHFSWPSSTPTWQSFSPPEPSRPELGTQRHSAGSMYHLPSPSQPGPAFGNGQNPSYRASAMSMAPEQPLHLPHSATTLAPSGLGQLHRSHSNASLQTLDSTISGFTGFSDPPGPGLVSRSSMLTLRDDGAVPLRSMSGRERSRALLQHLANR